jgi:hypothetical protein
LFAVLISSIILLIGLGIFRITVKETILSSAARESMIAFFASDGGLECGLYEENKNFGFRSAGVLDCADQSVTYDAPSGTEQLSEFSVAFPIGCARVEVRRNYFPPDGPAVPHVQIISRGYNVCNGNQPDNADPVLLERVLELTYPRPI